MRLRYVVMAILLIFALAPRPKVTFAQSKGPSRPPGSPCFIQRECTIPLDSRDCGMNFLGIRISDPGCEAAKATQNRIYVEQARACEVIKGAERAECSDHPCGNQPNQRLTSEANGLRVWVCGINHDVIAIMRNDQPLVYDPSIAGNTWQGQYGQSRRKDGEQDKGIAKSDIVIGSDLVAIRYGINADFLRLYGFNKNTVKVDVLLWPSADGIFYVESKGREILTTFGNRSDWHRKLCWDGTSWTTSTQTPLSGWGTCDYPVPQLKAGAAVGEPNTGDRDNGPRLLALP
jgi:hypothetical protein